jgi:hypothetical protein
MKKIIFLFAICQLTSQFLLTAQEKNSRLTDAEVGISFSSFGDNIVFRFTELTGAASYTGDNFYTFGINYLSGINTWLETETGLEFSKHNIIIHPNLPPDMDNAPRNASFELINIPVTVRANFLKYFFVNGGLLFDFDVSKNSPIDNQTGIGTILGLAVKYSFDCGVSAFVNPYTKAHTLIPFSADNYHQRLWENGFRVGITYDLGKLK